MPNKLKIQRAKKMGYLNIYHKISAKRAIKTLQKVQAQEDLSQQVKSRINTLEFYKEFGLNAALKHANISRTTLYNWQKKYKEYGANGLI